MGHALRVHNDKLVFEFSGLEELEVLARRLEIDPCDVEAVFDNINGWDGLRGLLELKIAGTGIPGHIVEGRYLLRGGGEAIVAVRDPSRAIRVRLRRGPYREVIVDVDDKQSSLLLIMDLVSSCDTDRRPNALESPKR